MHPVSISIEKTYQWADGVIDWPLPKTTGLLVIEKIPPSISKKEHLASKS